MIRNALVKFQESDSELWSKEKLPNVEGGKKIVEKKMVNISICSELSRLEVNGTKLGSASFVLWNNQRLEKHRNVQILKYRQV